MSTRTPGQRPAWCPHQQPEQAHTPDGARMFTTWVRECSPRTVPWGVDLVDEDIYTGDGVQTTGTRVQVYDPERPLTLDEAEQFALHLIDAVKTAQQAH